jgi:hypothetical protein
VSGTADPTASLAAGVQEFGVKAPLVTAFSSRGRPWPAAATCSSRTSWRRAST